MFFKLEHFIFSGAKIKKILDAKNIMENGLKKCNMNVVDHLIMILSVISHHHLFVVTRQTCPFNKFSGSSLFDKERRRKTITWRRS